VRHATFLRVWRAAVKACGLDGTERPLVLHDLRDHAASVLISAGASPADVAQQLGHKDASITLRVYSHAFPDRLDSLAEKMSEAWETEAAKNVVALRR
jgi:integrase